MPKKKLSLTWAKGAAGRAGRWRKMIKGQLFYFHGGRGKSDREAYRAAVEECKKLQAEILSKSEKPNAKEYSDAIENWEAAKDWCEKNQEHPELVEIATKKVKALRKRLSGPRPRALNDDDLFQSWLFRGGAISDSTHQLPKRKLGPRAPLQCMSKLSEDDRRNLLHQLAMYPEDKKKMLWEDRISSYKNASLPHDKTIAGSVETYLEYHKTRSISPSRYGNIKRTAEAFRDFVGGGKELQEISETLLRRFYTHLKELVSKKNIKPATARDMASGASQYIRWAWKEGAIDQQPRNLGDCEIAVPPNEIKVFKQNEIEELWLAANKRMRLFILLALNCGMTQKDISDLKPSEVNWTAGTISRKRSKTKNHESTPTVTFRLWPETLRLIKQLRVKGSESHVLLNNNGTPYKSEKINAKGNPIKVDIIGKEFLALRKSCGFKDRSFINLKKTSRSLLEDNKEFNAVAELFVGRSPRTVSERHYAKPAENWLAEATDWLRESLEIKKLSKIKPTS